MLNSCIGRDDGLCRHWTIQEFSDTTSLQNLQAFQRWGVLSWDLHPIARENEHIDLHIPSQLLRWCTMLCITKNIVHHPCDIQWGPGNWYINCSNVEHWQCSHWISVDSQLFSRNHKPHWQSVFSNRNFNVNETWDSAKICANHGDLDVLMVQVARMHKESLEAQRSGNLSESNLNKPAVVSNRAPSRLLSMRSSGRFRRTPQVRELQKSNLSDASGQDQTSKVAEK